MGKVDTHKLAIDGKEPSNLEVILLLMTDTLVKSLWLKNGSTCGQKSGLLLVESPTKELVIILFMTLLLNLLLLLDKMTDL